MNSVLIEVDDDEFNIELDEEAYDIISEEWFEIDINDNLSVPISDGEIDIQEDEVI